MKIKAERYTRYVVRIALAGIFSSRARIFK